MIEISKIRNNLMIEVQGCPVPKIDKAVVQAIRQLCEDSLCLKKTMTVDGTFSASAGGDYYIITTNLTQYNFWANTEPVDPMVCKIDDVEYVLSSFDIGDGMTDLSNVLSGNRKFYFFINQYTMQIFPFESTDSTVEIVLSISMKPTEDSEFVDEYVYRNYQRAIEQRALFILKSIRNTPWTDIEMAVWHGNEYLSELGKARIRVKTGGFPVTQTVVGGYF